MLRHIMLLTLALGCGLSASSALAQDQASNPKPAATQTGSRATAGELESVSSDGKTIKVKASGGASQVFKVTAKTTVTGAEDGAKGVALAGKEGSHVVVKYTGEGGEQIARAVTVAAKGTLDAIEGTVTHVDKAGHKVTVKLADGTEKTFDLTKDAMVDFGNGVYDGTKYAGKKGEQVVVYATVKPGKSVVHLFKKL